MMRFLYSIVHVPGKTLCTADTLSRSPVDSQQETTLQEETENFVEAIVSHLLATESQLDKYRNAQKMIPSAQLLRNIVRRAGLVNVK